MDRADQAQKSLRGLAESSSNGTDVIDLDELYRTALRRRNPSGSNESLLSNSKSCYRSQAAVAAAVFALHAVALWLLRGTLLPSTQPAALADLQTPVFTVIRRLQPPDAVPLPEFRVQKPNFDSTAISLITFTDPDAGLVGGITAPSSAPQLDPAVPLNVSSYALRAGLTAGEAVTLVLAVEVLADGSAGSIAIVGAMDIRPSTLPPLPVYAV